jgi:hypothetical protein
LSRSFVRTMAGGPAFVAAGALADAGDRWAIPVNVAVLEFHPGLAVGLPAEVDFELAGMGGVEP